MGGSSKERYSFSCFLFPVSLTLTENEWDSIALQGNQNNHFTFSMVSLNLQLQFKMIFIFLSPVGKDSNRSYSCFPIFSFLNSINPPPSTLLCRMCLQNFLLHGCCLDSLQFFYLLLNCYVQNWIIFNTFQN